MRAWLEIINNNLNLQLHLSLSYHRTALDGICTATTELLCSISLEEKMRSLLINNYIAALIYEDRLIATRLSKENKFFGKKTHFARPTHLFHCNLMNARSRNSYLQQRLPWNWTSHGSGLKKDRWEPYLANTPNGALI